MSKFHENLLIIIIFDNIDPFYIDLTPKLHNNLINENKNKTNANNNSTTKLRLGVILAISVITVLMISPSSVTQYAYATDAPIITTLIADDPDDLDDVYSIDDIITITFHSDTNEPGGTGIQRLSAVDDLFTFTESIGQRYRGQWTAADTFTITINSVDNAAH